MPFFMTFWQRTTQTHNLEEKKKQQTTMMLRSVTALFLILCVGISASKHLEEDLDFMLHMSDEEVKEFLEEENDSFLEFLRNEPGAYDDLVGSRRKLKLDDLLDARVLSSFVTPSWFQQYKAQYGRRAKKCKFLNGVAPKDGSSCQKMKMGDYSCLFGEVTCPGTDKAQPNYKCDCRRSTNTWDCSKYNPCPTANDKALFSECPIKHPLHYSTKPTCNFPLGANCEVGYERCCKETFPQVSCSCNNEGEFDCENTDACLGRTCPEQGQCPENQPSGFCALADEDISCAYGEECCCGKCTKNTLCSCDSKHFEWKCHDVAPPSTCPSQCPDKDLPEIHGESCPKEDAIKNIGTAKGCCGKTGPEFSCSCDNGQWMCERVFDPSERCVCEAPPSRSKSTNAFISDQNEKIEEEPPVEAESSSEDQNEQIAEEPPIEAESSSEDQNEQITEEPPIEAESSSEDQNEPIAQEPPVEAEPRSEDEEEGIITDKSLTGLSTTEETKPASPMESKISSSVPAPPTTSLSGLSTNEETKSASPMEPSISSSAPVPPPTDPLPHVSKCPVDAPFGKDIKCDVELRCKYGEESCCGETFSSHECSCQAGGTFACQPTDHCSKKNCPIEKCPEKAPSNPVLPICADDMSCEYGSKVECCGKVYAQETCACKKGGGFSCKPFSKCWLPCGSAWPKVVGKSCSEAQKHIQNDNDGLAQVVCVPQSAKDFIPGGYKDDRVRIFHDDNGNVAEVPVIG